MAEKSFYECRVQPQEVDFTLKMTIPNLVESILNVAGRDAYGKGFGVDALQADDHTWVLSRMAVELDRRPEQYAKFRIATWISDYGRLLSTRNFQLMDDSGRVFGRAVTEWAMIDMRTRRAVDLRAVGDAHSQALVDEPSPMEKARKIRSVAPTSFFEHRAAYSDIDFNRHVNTMRYFDLMFDRLPLELLTSDRAMRCDLHFMKECRLGQILRVGMEPTDQGARFEIDADQDYVALRCEVGWL